MRILAIDGGGIRGMIPAIVLAEIERRTGRRAADLFDLIAGTSTGGILACGLTRPGTDGTPTFTAADLIGLYESEGPEIFERRLLKRITSVGGLTDERYDDSGLNAALRRYLDGAVLSQTVTDTSSPRTTSSAARRSSSAPGARGRIRRTTSRSSMPPAPRPPRPRTSSPRGSTTSPAPRATR